MSTEGYAYTRRHPCSTCPFRRSNAGFYQGKTRGRDCAIAAVEYLRTTGVEWPCHDDEIFGTAECPGHTLGVIREPVIGGHVPARACRGWVAMAAGDHEPHEGLVRAEREGRVSPSYIQGHPECYSDPEEFLEAEDAQNIPDDERSYIRFLASMIDPEHHVFRPPVHAHRGEDGGEG